MPAGPANCAAVAGPSSPTVSVGAAAGDGGDDVRFRVDAAHAVVVHVGDVEIAGSRIERDVARHVQVRAGRRAAVADVLRIAGHAVARHGVDQPGLGVDHAHAVVQRVGDVDVAVGRGGDRAGRVQRGLGRRLVVAVVAVLARSGDGGDDPGRSIDAADAVVVRVGDDQIAVGRDRDAVRRVELRHDRGAVVAGEAGAQLVAAGDRLDLDVVRVDAADDVVVRVGDVDVAVRPRSPGRPGRRARPPAANRTRPSSPSCRR